MLLCKVSGGMFPEASANSSPLLLVDGLALCASPGYSEKCLLLDATSGPRLPDPHS